MITLERSYLPDGSATFGKWSMDGYECYTLENAWKANQVRVSCIPEGVYTLKKRYSPIVQSSTDGEFGKGWEVTDVPSRTYIMIHPGNWDKDTAGCILPGRHFSWHGRYGPMVVSSRITFTKLMAALEPQEEWTLDIRCKTAEWP